MSSAKHRGFRIPNALRSRSHVYTEKPEVNHMRREKGRTLERGETYALEEGLELVDEVVARDGALDIHVRQVRVGFGEEVLDEGGRVFERGTSWYDIVLEG
ncbi:uncharacterized protein HKW66_Vig0184000 [Vigna angularis]|uniref:Uncharacterized protein n=1 Tax=Phaseolus angularis TaxID=3914 RepID=A0A8T0KTS2_PHAAN|nr:uncharacterized protein HKW66_Vig0184000 [Vigna angularis]